MILVPVSLVLYARVYYDLLPLNAFLPCNIFEKGTCIISLFTETVLLWLLDMFSALTILSLIKVLDDSWLFCSWEVIIFLENNYLGSSTLFFVGKVLAKLGGFRRTSGISAAAEVLRIWPAVFACLKKKIAQEMSQGLMDIFAAYIADLEAGEQWCGSCSNQSTDLWLICNVDGFKSIFWLKDVKAPRWWPRRKLEKCIPFLHCTLCSCLTGVVLDEVLH